MLLRVTKEDIEKGEPQSCYQCPIALALKRAGFERVSVEADGIYADEQFAPSTYQVDDFVAAFDSEQDVEPTEFDLPFEPPLMGPKEGE